MRQGYRRTNAVGDFDVVVGRNIEHAESRDALLEDGVLGAIAVVLQLGFGIVYRNDASRAGVEEEGVGGEKESTVTWPERRSLSAAGELLEELKGGSGLVEGNVILEAHVDPGTSGACRKSRRQRACQQEKSRCSDPPNHVPRSPSSTF